MFIEALADFETATNNLRKGQIAEIPDEQGERAIEAGVARQVSVAEGISSIGQSLGVIETAAAGPQAKKVVRRAAQGDDSADPFAG